MGFGRGLEIKSFAARDFTGCSAGRRGVSGRMVGGGEYVYMAVQGNSPGKQGGFNLKHAAAEKKFADVPDDPGPEAKDLKIGSRSRVQAPIPVFTFTSPVRHILRFGCRS